MHTRSSFEVLKSGIHALRGVFAVSTWMRQTHDRFREASVHRLLLVAIATLLLLAEPIAAMTLEHIQYVTPLRAGSFLPRPIGT